MSEFNWESIAANPADPRCELAKSMLQRVCTATITKGPDGITSKIAEYRKAEGFKYLQPVDPEIEAQIEAEKLKEAQEAAQADGAEAEYLRKTQERLCRRPDPAPTRTVTPPNEPAPSQAPSRPNPFQAKDWRDLPPPPRDEIDDFFENHGQVE